MDKIMKNACVRKISFNIISLEIGKSQRLSAYFEVVVRDLSIGAAREVASLVC